MQVLEKAYQDRNKKLNKIELLKQSRLPIDAFEKLRSYADEGYASIPNEDKSYFLKCFGIFDRPQTPERFMIRVRIPGGQLTVAQAKVLGEVAKAYGNDYIDITTRMQVELRYLSIENIPTVLERLLDVGISTFQTGVDNFRNILTDPLDGVAMDASLEAFPILEALQAKFLQQWDWVSALPRKFNTGISAAFANRCNVMAQDCGFILAKKEGIFGYNVYLGGKVGQVARDADIFLADQAEVETFYQALIELFRDYGFRDNRNKNRLHFMLEQVGMASFRAALEEKVGAPLKRAGDMMMQMESFEAKEGKVALKDGTFALHSVVPSGIFSGSGMMEASDTAQNFGDGRIRLTVDQNLYILGVKPEMIATALETPFFKRYKNVNTPYFNHMIACAGTEHCPFGVIPNKPDAIKMSSYLSKTVPLDEGMVRIYWSACVKGCGIHGLGDIGFEGCKAKVDGKAEYGVHILVGGKMIGNSKEGRSVLKSVPLRFAPRYVAELVKIYRDHKNKNESFERFYERYLSHYSSAIIGFVMRFNAYCSYIEQANMKIELSKIDFSTRIENYEIYSLGKWLYKKVIGNPPYVHEELLPRSSDSLQSVKKTDPSIDGVIAEMIDKMVHADSEARAAVFSELYEYLPQYEVV